jgi:hypothetical protein
MLSNILFEVWWLVTSQRVGTLSANQWERDGERSIPVPLLPGSLSYRSFEAVWRLVSLPGSDRACTSSGLDVSFFSAFGFHGSFVITGWWNRFVP